MKRLAVVLLLGGGLLLAYFAVQDIRPPDTSDLTLVRVAVADADNAYTYFSAAATNFHRPTDPLWFIAYMQDDGADVAVLERALEENAAALELVRKGIGCEIFQIPALDRHDDIFPHVSTWLGLGRLMIAQAAEARRSGRLAEAADVCAVTLRFAERLMSGSENLVMVLVGTAIMDYAFLETLHVARSDELLPEDSALLALVLAELDDAALHYARAYRGEYAYAVRMIDQIEAGDEDVTDLLMAEEDVSRAWTTPFLDRFYYQVNRTKDAYANMIRILISGVQAPYSELPRNEIRAFHDFGDRPWLILARRNAVGHLLLATVTPSFEGSLNRRYRLDCMKSATELVLACQRFAREQGAYPLTLDELVPSYIDAVPMDPYDGSRFRYVSEERMVYAIGPNLQDHGGSRTLPDGEELAHNPEDRWNAEDIVFFVDRPWRRSGPD